MTEHIHWPTQTPKPLPSDQALLEITLVNPWLINPTPTTQQTPTPLPQCLIVEGWWQSTGKCEWTSTHLRSPVPPQYILSPLEDYLQAEWREWQLTKTPEVIDARTRYYYANQQRTLPVALWRIDIKRNPQ